MNYKASLLIVDDEPQITEMVSTVLSEQGYKVSAAYSGEEAVEKVGKDKFDLVIMDIMMPGMDGIATLGEIKKLDPEVEVIMATGHGTMGTAIQSMRKGAFDYLHKPFAMKELFAAVEKALEKRRFNDITKAIFSTIRSEELLRIIIDSAARILKADEALLVLQDANGSPYIAVSDGLEGGERTASRLEACARTFRRLAAEGSSSVALIEDPKKDPLYADIALIGEVKFALLLPLIENNRPVGLININRLELDEYFNENDLQRAKIFASLANLALKNARLFKQLQDANAQLIQAEKLAALGQLAGGLAHEINNPLSGILGLTQLILETVEKNSQNHQDLKDIEKAVFRCKKIISSLLSFARQEKTRMEPLCVNEVIEETLVLCAKQLELKRIGIAKDFGKDLPPVNGDFQQLMQVFLNLFTNARDAMPDGGTLTIRTALSAPGPDKKALMTVTVADTGAGIPPEIMDRVFDPFFTTKPAGKGTGLGLSVCLGIINKHGGAIQARSGPGKGTVFTVYLPV